MRYLDTSRGLITPSFVARVRVSKVKTQNTWWSQVHHWWCVQGAPQGVSKNLDHQQLQGPWSFMNYFLQNECHVLWVLPRFDLSSFGLRIVLKSPPQYDCWVRKVVEMWWGQPPSACSFPLALTRTSPAHHPSAKSPSRAPAPPSSAEEPRQLGRAQLSPTERLRWTSIYCGLTGHFIASCPSQPIWEAHQ